MGQKAPSNIKRNTLVNLAGAALPALLALAVVPAFLSAIGQARYGVLAIVWTLLSFTEILDMGFGRATANKIASLHDSPREAARPVFWTALTVNLGMGIVGGGLMLLVGSVLLTSVFKIPDGMRAEAFSSLPWLALAVPLVTTSSVLTGTLEGLERFATVNWIGVGATVLMQVAPLLTAWIGGPDLALLIGATVLARAAGSAAFAIACLRVLGPGVPRVDLALAGGLFRFGGWITVTALLTPVLSTLDRFAIGAVRGMEAVTHYTIPYNLTTRLWILPASLTRTLFPRFAMVERSEAEGLLREATAALLVVLTPIVVFGLVVMEPFLQVWLGRETGDASAAVGAILLAGVWINSLGHPPYSFLQGRGRPDVTAKFHLLELLPYLAALGVGLWFFGIEGAAMAWTFRVVADTALLYWAVGIPVNRQPMLAAGTGLVVTTCCLALWAFDQPLVRALGGGALVVAAIGWAWRAAPYSVRVLLQGRLRQLSVKQAIAGALNMSSEQEPRIPSPAPAAWDEADLAPPEGAHRPRGLYVDAVKPAVDFLGAVAMLAVFGPVMAIVAIAVKLDSPGPALYTQDRVGCGGKLFRIFKFRSMRTDAGGPVLTQVGDPRITRVGRFIRRTSLDELPQFFNILRGEMSFVGPRPEVPSIVATEYTPEMKGALAVRPGLSGWAQVHGRDDLPIPVKLGYDLEYVRRISPWLDLRIAVLTPGLLISGRGIK